MFKAVNPSFFKIILDDTLRDGKLGIPRRFVRKHGHDLPDVVYLKVPGVVAWKVELRKCDGEVWLEKGWKDFADYYSLERGSFLVFEYHGNQDFHVKIFDVSATEIDYPLSSNKSDKERPNVERKMKEPEFEETEGDDVSIEVLDDFLPQSEKRKRKSPLACSPPTKRMRTRNSVSTSVSAKSNRQSSGKELETTMKRNRNTQCATRQFEAKRGNASGMQTLTNVQKKDALCTAEKAFVSKNPFFMVVMQPSYIYPGNKIPIPKEFSAKYFKRRCGNATINVSNGRTWSLRYHHKSIKAELHHGWKEFVQENCLNVGDVCVFELIKDTENSFKVAIFRFLQHENQHRTLANQAENKEEEKGADNHFIQTSSYSRAPKAVESANKLAVTSPAFSVTMRSYYLTHPNLGVPKYFMLQLNQSCAQSVKLQFRNKQWPVMLLWYPQHGQGKLSSGWLEFVRENALKVGDVCMFKLSNYDDNEMLLLKVSILRKVGD